MNHPNPGLSPRRPYRGHNGPRIIQAHKPLPHRKVVASGGGRCCNLKLMSSFFSPQIMSSMDKEGFLIFTQLLQHSVNIFLFYSIYSRMRNLRTFQLLVVKSSDTAVLSLHKVTMT